MAVIKTPDNRLVIPEYLKQLSHTPLFRGVKRNNIKLPKIVVETIVKNPDNLMQTYEAALRLFGDALQDVTRTDKKQIFHSAVTNKETQLLFCQYTYPLPHVKDVAIVYRSCIYQTVKGEVIDRHTSWALFKEDNVILADRDGIDQDMRGIVEKYPNDEVLLPLTNIALSFFPGSVIPRMIVPPVGNMGFPRTVSDVISL